MTKTVMTNKEFAYWGEIGKWKNIFGVEWLFLRDLDFNSIGYMEENNDPISELKDGTTLTYNNARALLEKFNSMDGKSDIFARFPALDKKESDIRGKADAMIMTGMYDIYAKEQEEKKKQFVQNVKEKSEFKEEPTPVLVVKKKLTQGQMKKLKKQQESNQ